VKEFGTWTQSRLTSTRRCVVKELGLFVRWGRVFPGYEKEAVGFYDEVVRYFREKLHSGALTSFEPFLFMSGDHDESYGVFIMKGPEAKVIGIFEDPRRLEIEAKGGQLCAHITTDLLIVGEEVQEQIARFSKVNTKVLAGNA
jgi:hypothetical protein